MDVIISIPPDPALSALQQQITALSAQVATLNAVESPAYLTALAQYREIMVDSTVNGPAGNGSYGGGYWAAQVLAGQNNATTGGLVYYDGPRVYYQIADATGDPGTWYPVAKKAIQIYRDWYVDAQTPPSANGYTIFPKGLYMDWMRTGDAASKQAVLDLANHASFAPFDTPRPWLPGPGTMREMAYGLEAHLYAIDLGAVSNTANYALHLGQMRLYMAQTLELLNGQTPTGPDPLNAGPPIDCVVRPFMVGIGCESLIEYWRRTRDTTILPLIQPVLEALWHIAALPDGSAMYYTACAQGVSGSGFAPSVISLDGGDGTPTQPAPVLNMLIAPAYAWVYAQTKDPVWKERADSLFIGCMTACYRTALLASPAGKALDQVYKWAPDYFTWRDS